jgi:hypothetical protein
MLCSVERLFVEGTAYVNRARIAVHLLPYQVFPNFLPSPGHFDVSNLNESLHKTECCRQT